MDRHDHDNHDRGDYSGTPRRIARLPMATVAARLEDVEARTASRHTESVGAVPDRVLARAAWPNVVERQALT